MSLVSIIIPTFNNRQYLEPCVHSIMMHQSTPGLFKIIIVNNGDIGSVPKYDNPEIQVINAGKNLGWEGGLKEGLKYCQTPFVVFMNDDTYIPLSSVGWLLQMLEGFSDPLVAGVGPSSNCVMGVQNIFVPAVNERGFQVNFLIGFCLMLRKEYLEKVGGIDDSLPNHGDDLDLSIRLRKAGYKLLCDKSVFVFHHGFKTGQREKGAEWNSVQMTEKTNTYLIKKHGLKDFVKYIFHPVVDGPSTTVTVDVEGDVCRRYAKGDVLEVGCGPQKTVENSTGIDIVPRGEFIPGLVGKISIADIQADINEPLPVDSNKFDTFIARHILEHLIDPIKTLKEWGRVVRAGGRMIIAVPNQNLRNSIPMNYQHVHAFTPESLKTLMEELGWHTEAVEDPKNNVSLVGVFNKNGVKNGF